jgi:hypothetical protein
MTTWSGLAAVLVGVALAATACSSGAELTDADLRSIYAQTIDRVCAEAGPYGGCSGPVEVSDRFEAGFEPAELPIPGVVRETIEAELPHAEFTAGLMGEETVRLLIGPYEMVRDGVVGVQVGYACGGTCGSGRILYFEWVDDAWQPTSPSAIGEPDRRWVA